MSEIKKLGLLAGNGMMPLEIAKHCKQKNLDLFVVCLDPFADVSAYSDVPHVSAKLGEAGKILKSLNDNKVSHIVMAGGIKRPAFKELIPDREGFKIMLKLAMKKSSDDNIFRSVIREFETRGFEVVGIEDVVPEMMFAKGLYGKIKPSDEDMDDIARGIEVAKALGRVDAGQATVVQEGIILAVEAVEGTDAMLSRASSLKKPGKAPVMVKIKKLNQETRTDMPALGKLSIDRLKKYGIKGIAVEAGGILLIERDEVITAADEAGIFIIGIEVDYRTE